MIRGGSATGKTTALYQFCRQKNLKESKITVKGKLIDILTGSRIIAIGRYNRNGLALCDSDMCIHSKAEFYNAIAEIFRAGPETVLESGKIIGSTVEQCRAAAKISKKYGYEPVFVTFFTDIETEADRAECRRIERTGNDQYWENAPGSKLDKMWTVQRNMVRGALRLRAEGYTSILIDTSEIRKEEMWKEIEKQL